MINDTKMPVLSDVEAPARQVCVYTSLIGRYEQLNEQTVAIDSDIPFICLTDDPELRSETWQIRLVTPLFGMDPIRSHKDFKLRPHLHLPDFDASLYIDNSVLLTQPPEFIFERHFQGSGFCLPGHSFRESVMDEFITVARLGFDDQTRIFEQLNHYLIEYPQVLQEKPYWGAILFRDHSDSKVRTMLEAWFSHVQRYSRRDQLSVNVAFRQTKLMPGIIGIDNHCSWFHSWPHTEGRNRKKGPRCLATSLSPPVARFRELELALVDQARLHELAMAEQARQHTLELATLKRVSVQTLQSDVLRQSVREGTAPLDITTVSIAGMTDEFGMFLLRGTDQAAKTIHEGGWQAFERPLPEVFFAIAKHAPGTIINVNVNTGFYSFLGLSAHPANRVVGFEPDPQVHALLMDNIKLNAQLAERLLVKQAGLSDKSCKMTLYIPPKDHGLVETSSSLEKDFTDAHSETLEVEVTTLDDFLRLSHYQASPVTLMNVDVAGHEKQVFAGSEQTIRSMRPWIAVELLPRSDFEYFNGFINRHQYHDLRLGPRGVVDATKVGFDPEAWNHLLVPAEHYQAALLLLEELGLAIVTPNLSREEKILWMINKEGYGLEVGASHNPIAPKRAGYQVHVIDTMNREQLIEKYRSHNVNLENIEEVDFVWEGETYAELTGKKNFYDWIIASHVIEHTTDLIGFLNGCEEILNDSGVLSLVVPDLRYCFDSFRPISGLARVIDTHFLHNPARHSPGTVVEFYLNFVTKGGQGAWYAGAEGDFAFGLSVELARQAMEKALHSAEYQDVHAWCFTPSSFRLLLHDLRSLGLTDFHELAYYPTSGCEFYITLGRAGEHRPLDRLELLKQIEAEMAD